MSTRKSLSEISFLDAVGVTLPAGTAFRSVAQMVRKVGVPETVDRLVQQALQSGRSATYIDAMRYAVGRVDDVQHFLNGQQTEVEAYRKMRAEEGSLDGPDAATKKPRPA